MTYNNFIKTIDLQS